MLLRNSKTDLTIPMMITGGNGQKSFVYGGASIWNSLDLDSEMAPSINAFKSKLMENNPFLYIEVYCCKFIK